MHLKLLQNSNDAMWQWSSVGVESMGFNGDFQKSAFTTKYNICFNWKNSMILQWNVLFDSLKYWISPRVMNIVDIFLHLIQIHFTATFECSFKGGRVSHVVLNQPVYYILYRLVCVEFCTGQQWGHSPDRIQTSS